jgi:antitoxin component of RelBE/YafQ-DinJ toxin-antitoxin module
MPDKTETVSVRITRQKREEIQQWAEEHGFTEADAVREMINRCLYDQRRIDEIAADEEIKRRLDDIEEEVREIDKNWWTRIFRN